jgi:G6PDH family F420-dependent oxidoreductase
MSLGVVNAPGQRYHPVIVAQAVATLAEMYPGRFWLAVGTGEYLNEHVTGERWPEKEFRRRRLREAVAVMKALWAGETVSHRGTFVVDEAKLYTVPQQAPLVLGAALTEPTSEWLGGWADGLITAGKKVSDLRRLLDAFRRGGGEGKPMFLQAALSFAATDEEAIAAAFDQWRVAGLNPDQLADTRTPRVFDALTASVDKETIVDRLRVSASIEQHIDWLRQDFELGFQSVYLNHVGRNLAGFIDAFGEHVLPKFR